VIVHDAVLKKLVVAEMTRDVSGRPGVLELSGAAKGDMLEFYNEEVAEGEKTKEQVRLARKRAVDAAFASNVETLPAVAIKRPMSQHIEPIADATQISEEGARPLRRFN